MAAQLARRGDTGDRRALRPALFDPGSRPRVRDIRPKVVLREESMTDF